jgi:DNA primase
VDYLKGRGLTGEIARDFGLGFAPPGWDNLLKHLSSDTLQQKAMIEAGLLIENAETGKRYDRFRDRVMFPIRDTRGRIIAFGGRVLGDDKPKYLNSPETPVFHKARNSTASMKRARTIATSMKSSWSKAIWTSSPSPSKACAMPSPRWVPRPAKSI